MIFLGAKQPGVGGKGGIGCIEHLAQCDISKQALLRGINSAREVRESNQDGGVNVETCHMLADEEFLPFPPGSFDLVLRCVR